MENSNWHSTDGLCAHFLIAPDFLVYESDRTLNEYSAGHTIHNSPSKHVV